MRDTERRSCEILTKHASSHKVHLWQNHSKVHSEQISKLVKVVLFFSSNRFPRPFPSCATGPSVYKKFCESVDRDWEVPVMFTGPDGATVFKVLDVGKYDEKQKELATPEGQLGKGSTKAARPPKPPNGFQAPSQGLRSQAPRGLPSLQPRLQSSKSRPPAMAPKPRCLGNEAFESAIAWGGSRSEQ